MDKNGAGEACNETIGPCRVGRGHLVLFDGKRVSCGLDNHIEPGTIPTNSHKIWTDSLHPGTLS